MEFLRMQMFEIQNLFNVNEILIKSDVIRIRSFRLPIKTPTYIILFILCVQKKAYRAI